MTEVDACVLGGGVAGQSFYGAGYAVTCRVCGVERAPHRANGRVLMPGHYMRVGSGNLLGAICQGSYKVPAEYRDADDE